MLSHSLFVVFLESCVWDGIIIAIKGVICHIIDCKIPTVGTFWNVKTELKCLFSTHTHTHIKNKQIHAATHYLQYTIRHKHRHSLYDFLFVAGPGGNVLSLTGSELWRHSSMAGCVEVWHQIKPVIKAGWKPVICAHCLCCCQVPQHAL